MKKGVTAPASAEAREFLRRMSKAAIADCLIDALALMRGDGDEVEEKDARDFCEPRLIRRGDRVPG